MTRFHFAGSLVVLFTLLMGASWAGEAWGPDNPGSSPSRGPVVVSGVSRPTLPSPRPSPGGIVYLAVDEYGRMLQSPSPNPVSLTAGNIGVTSNAGGGALNITGNVNATITGSTTTGTHGAVSVDTTSTGTEVVASNATMKGWLVQNTDTATDAYLGFGSVSSSNGLKLAPGAIIGMDMVGGYVGQVKVISNSGTISIRRAYW